MTSRVLALVVCLLVAAAPAVGQGVDDPVWIVRAFYEDPGDIPLLNGFDLLEYHDLQQGYLLVAIRPHEAARLEELGFRLEIDERLTEEVNAPREIPTTPAAGIPGYPCYRTVEESYALAAQIALDHSDLASWIDVGDSWDRQNGFGGYDLRVLRLTNNAIPGPKPKLFLTGSIHAREYTPAELVTRFGEYLIDNYGTDPDVTWILDHHEVHLMLQANPDGRKHAETGLFWRKNTNQDYCSPTSTSRGADLNRNFEFEWACCGGASNNQCSSLYRGPFAASEPEVQAIESHLLAEFPDQRADSLSSPAPVDATGVYIDIHSAGELVLWPWGFGGQAPNGIALRTLSRKLAYFNDYLPIQAVDLYPTDGTTLDFGYGELGVASLAYELGTSFFQSCSIFENIVLPDNLPSLLYAAKVSRTPYLTPAGPDALQVTVDPASVTEGAPFELTATIDDTHYSANGGVEPTQNVAGAEYYLDVPPWTGGASPAGMLAVDGSFDGPVEDVTVVVPSLGLTAGRHILFVRGRDTNGNWGAFSAVFINVSDQQADDDNDGVANGNDCAPSNGSLWAAPSEARDLTIGKEPFANVTWYPPDQPGATFLDYDVLRADAATAFGSAVCLATLGAVTSTTDGELPASGSLFHYLVRAANPCGTNLGQDSSGAPRSGVDCSP